MNLIVFLFFNVAKFSTGEARDKFNLGHLPHLHSNWVTGWGPWILSVDEMKTSENFLAPFFTGGDVGHVSRSWLSCGS